MKDMFTKSVSVVLVLVSGTRVLGNQNAIQLKEDDSEYWLGPANLTDTVGGDEMKNYFWLKEDALEKSQEVDDDGVHVQTGVENEDDDRAHVKLCVESVNIAGAIGNIQFGYHVSRKPFTPTLDHNAYRVFDFTKLKKLAENEFIPDDSGKSFSVSECTMSEFTSKFMSKFGMSGSGSGDFGTTFKASAEAEFSIEKKSESETCYAQKQTHATFGYIQMPGPPELLQDLMTSHCLQEIKAITSNEEAGRFIDNYGLAYFYKAVFGCVIKFKTTVKRTASVTKQNVKEKVEASYGDLLGNSIGGKQSMEVNFGTKDSENLSTLTMSHEGGKFSLYDKEDLTAWKESCEERPVIVSYDVRPIYNLLSDEKDSKAYKFLKNEFEKRIEGMENLMPNYDYEEITGEVAIKSRYSGNFLTIQHQDLKVGKWSAWRGYLIYQTIPIYGLTDKVQRYETDSAQRFKIEAVYGKSYVSIRSLKHPQYFLSFATLLPEFPMGWFTTKRSYVYIKSDDGFVTIEPVDKRFYYLSQKKFAGFDFTFHVNALPNPGVYVDALDDMVYNTDPRDMLQSQFQLISLK